MALNYLVLVLSYDTKCFWYAIKLELKVKVVFLSMESNAVWILTVIRSRLPDPPPPATRNAIATLY